MFDNFIFIMIFFIFSSSFFLIITSPSYVKKLIGLNILQLSVILFYIAISYIDNASSPIRGENTSLFVNPLPHVLMLTAIVVGVSTLSVGVSIVMKINK